MNDLLWVLTCALCFIVGSYFGHSVKSNGLEDEISVFWFGIVCGAFSMIVIAAAEKLM